ncbi:MAG: response regulator transcription factor [Nostocaceae cyanobacterium]|nr:response regulator transcription factor [Nostocaceae cyanobacterium]
MLMLDCKPSSLRVLLVDDHELTRLSLQLAFSRQENIQVVGCASNGQEAVEMVKTCHPDVIILDLQMPVMDGWSASSHIKTIAPKTQIIAYSSADNSILEDKKEMANWDAFCQKDTPTKDLISLVKQLGEQTGKASISG